MTTRHIHCFTVKWPAGNKVPLEKIWAELGENIPVPCPYDGCLDGIVDLCCADINVDVESICQRYGYICGSLYKLEVDESEFNDAYMIVPVYKPDPPHYCLEKKPMYESNFG
jgi:hypothetical protein